MESEILKHSVENREWDFFSVPPLLTLGPALAIMLGSVQGIWRTAGRGRDRAMPVIALNVSGLLAIVLRPGTNNS